MGKGPIRGDLGAFKVLTLTLLYVAAYLFGGVPFAVLLGRVKGVDILSVGSGNPGMTNVGRALGPTWGAVCFVLDVSKGCLPALIARQIVHGPIGPFDAQLVWFSVGVVAIIGHCASPFLRFRGGKGVSTALGAIVATSPLIAALCFGLFLVVLAVTRYVSLASVIGVSSAIVFDLVVPGQTHQLLPVFVVLSSFVVYRHRRNIQRLISGSEPKLGSKGPSPAVSKENECDTTIEIRPTIKESL
jgi:glycerol-3-phosphate acyltransferase PlsY